MSSLIFPYKSFNIIIYSFILCIFIYFKFIIEINRNNGISNISQLINKNTKYNNDIYINNENLNDLYSITRTLKSLDNSYIMKKNYEIEYTVAIKDINTENCNNLLIDDPLFKYIPDTITQSCMIILKDNPDCNASLSEIILTPSNEYACLTKYPSILGGIGSVEIQVCSGQLYDLKLNVLHKNLFDLSKCPDFNGFHELLSENQYRFVCNKPNENVDVLGNPLIPLSYINDDDSYNEYDTNFINIRNRCTSMLYNSHLRYNNFLQKVQNIDGVSMWCDCDFPSNNKMHTYKRTSRNPCTMCDHKWKGADERIIKHSKYGITIARGCINHGTYPDLFEDLKFPCGSRSLISKTSCEEAILLVTNNLSPIALSNVMIN
ncbi:MAG: per os infectivity factor pif-2 [Cotesia congregata filamentous virus 2]